MACAFWKRAAAALLAGAGITLSAAEGEELILRQAGKPDRTCIIENAEPMANGAVKLRLRDTATNQILSVVDRRGSIAPQPTSHKSLKMFGPTPEQGMDPLFPGAAAGLMPEQPVPSAPEPKPVQKAGFLRKIFSPSPSPEPVNTPPAAEALPEVAVHMTALKDALRPSVRESAALALTRSPKFDAGYGAALLDAAQIDPAPSVRACCIRCLSARNFDDPSFRAALGVLAKDEDAGVRAEATRAMGKLGMN